MAVLVEGSENMVVALAKALELLGRENFDWDGSKVRTEAVIKSQLKVYLLQAAGIKLPYTFSIVWGGIAPRPHQLTDGVLFAFLRQQEFYTEKAFAIELTKEEELKVRQLKTLIKPPKGINKVTWLIYLCSLHYLAEVDFVNVPWSKIDISELKKALSARDISFEKHEKELDLAWQRLKQTIGRKENG